MAKDFRLSVEAETLLTKLRDYMQDAELAEGVSRESLRDVRDLLKMADADKADLERQLAAAEKRAEEAEAQAATARNEALEEAARVCDDSARDASGEVYQLEQRKGDDTAELDLWREVVERHEADAKAIRALKGGAAAPTQPQEPKP